MPEVLEVEFYRRLAERALDRPISGVDVPDPHALRGVTVDELGLTLVGHTFDAARRRGKLLLLDLSDATLGVRFGMTGGLVVDDELALDRLIYAPRAFGGKWIRARILFADGGELALHDPRRFGRIELFPDEGALGPDALTLTLGQLRAALAARPGSPGPPLKARLLDQAKIAGIGNLLADEILWRAGLAPTRPSASLSDAELRRLHRHLKATLAELLDEGGSHLGELMEQRHAGGVCPRDGTPLRRDTVGGRTTYWCPKHQR